MTETLTALDGTFLELEDADPSAHMHIGGIMLFGPTPSGAPPSLDDIRRHLGARIGALPRYRQRLSSLRATGLGWPHWEDDPGFAIEHHVRREALPAPGGWDELMEWASEFYARRLERSRPLWEMVLLEGLPDGRWGLATKTHHCMVDGVGAVDVAYLMLDATPEIGPPPVHESGEAPATGRHLPSLPRWITGPVGMVRHPRRAVAAIERAGALAELLANEEVRAAPHSSLNEPIGPERALRGLEVPLVEVKATAHGLGGKVNDVVLAAVTAGLREVLLGRGEELPAAGLRAMVPVDVRTEDEHGGVLGNKIISLFVDLPVAEPTPLGRFERVCFAARERKGSVEPLGADTLLSLAELAPPVLHSVFAQTMYATRLFNVTVTNVPGPQTTLYALGAPMRSVYPLVPLAAEHAVGIAVLSYDGGMCFGINADRDSMPDVDRLTAGIAAELTELQRLARAVSGAAS
jgi:WS/DGAT/MGAT family acyltransferase